ncbi:hypothetical protein CC80DRAFT_577620 [Byssothecium circinans]|uniref:Uncharacterized protein n=1 Tax=Byssothecium circinans TaxID=147558 RepID=A0A6A5UAD9_9PLEO|nr:hypothetical protein CC80DRAFT_577620 [Byssothecium circinans]
MEKWAPHLPDLAVRSHFNLTLNTTATMKEAPWTSDSAARAKIASLQLEQVQTLRTMHLTLGAFSLAMTMMTVFRIFSDAKRAAALQVPPRKRRFSALSNVHPAETFPLVLACGAVTQQILFVAVQSTSLRSYFSNNCRGLAMITFPAIFLIGYITLVFGIEVAIRAFKSERFAPRGKWNSTICIAVVAFLTLLTWMPTVIWPMFNLCFGSLIWFPVRYELIALAILISLVSLFLLLAALISIQLMKTYEMDPNERIAASRMCYYLLMSAVLYTLVIPVEVQAHREDFVNTLASSRIAEVALFSSGIFITFFHLFLRVNATRFVIKPMNQANSSSQPKRPKIRFFGPSDLEMNISGPMALQGGRRPETRQGLIDVGPEKNRFEFDKEYFIRPDRPLTPASARTQGTIDPTKWPLPPDPVQTSYTQPKGDNPGLHKRNKCNYSLFPTRAEDVPKLPATIYSPDKPNASCNLFTRRLTRRSSLGDTKSVTDVGEAFSFLTKPPPRFAGRHGRQDSTASSATVEIGLRFSLAPATLAAAKYTKAERPDDSSNLPAPLSRDNSDSSIETLGLPIQSPTPRGSFTEDILLGDTLTSFDFPGPPQRTLSPSKPSPGRTPAFPVLSPATYLQDQREKILPPTPTQTSAIPSPLHPQATPAPTQPPHHPGLSGLRMNPVSPASPRPASPSLSASTTTLGPTYSGRTSPTSSNRSRSPTAGIPLGAGTMARSPSRNGWI